MMRKLVPKMEGLHGRWEETVAERPGAVSSGPTSPERVSILGGFTKVDDAYRPPGVPHTIPQMFGSLRGIRASVHELDDNPADPRTLIDEEALAELETFARSAGALSIGYAEVDRKWIFKDKAILHTHAVVLTQEMDKERIDTAPSKAAGLAVHETYNHLGQTANAVARYLRSKGYSAHAGHPLNGMALYPPLGQAAHLGYRGIHGLLITPEMGPTVRLAAVFTSIENLPVPSGDNPHEWIGEFCDHCRLCVRKCPVDAIYTKPIVHEDGRITCVDDAKCLPFFATHDGCSICVAVCPFNKLGYERLHETARAHGTRHAVAEHV
jgi:ferredoxin